MKYLYIYCNPSNRLYSFSFTEKIQISHNLRLQIITHFIQRGMNKRFERKVRHIVDLVVHLLFGDSGEDMLCLPQS